MEPPPGAAPVVMAIKLADMYHNLLDLPNVAVTSGKTEFDTSSESEFEVYFRRKIGEFAPTLISGLRAYSHTWYPYAEWIESLMAKEIQSCTT